MRATDKAPGTLHLRSLVRARAGLLKASEAPVATAVNRAVSMSDNRGCWESCPPSLLVGAPSYSPQASRCAQSPCPAQDHWVLGVGLRQAEQTHLQCRVPAPSVSVHRFQAAAGPEAARVGIHGDGQGSMLVPHQPGAPLIQAAPRAGRASTLTTHCVCLSPAQGRDT